LKGNCFEIIVRDLKRVKLRVVVVRSEGAEHACEEDQDQDQPSDRGDGDNGNEIIEECFYPCDAMHINTMVERVRKSGFINYYGEQRVGDSGRSNDVGVRSIDIGRAMLKSDFAEAVDLLMRGRHKGKDGTFVEELNIRNVRKTWIESRDPHATLASFPKKGNAMARERIVLKGLKRYGKDKPLEALRCLPFNVRLFWVNAYQSYVWNKMATERIRLGSRPVKGDLYILNGKKNEVGIVSEPSSVKITDVVLPLPGYRIQYPTNEIGMLYKKFLDQEGVSFEKGTALEATAKGSYRHLVRVPHEINWNVIATVEDDADCIDDDKTTQAEYVKDAKFTFSLDSGSYATMLLRELMVSTISR